MDKIQNISRQQTVTKIMISVFVSVEKIVGEGEYVGYPSATMFTEGFFRATDGVHFRLYCIK